jgi:hypothetical protein
MAYTKKSVPISSIEPPDVRLIDGCFVKISTVVVHEFVMGDVEDPDLFAAEPLLAWQKSEVGEWVMLHSVDHPQWHRQVDYASYGYRYCVTARLKERDEIFFKLKFK